MSGCTAVSWLRTCCSTPLREPPALPMKARYVMMSLLVSVLPAPLSPLTCSLHAGLSNKAKRSLQRRHRSACA